MPRMSMTAPSRPASTEGRIDWVTMGAAAACVAVAATISIASGVASSDGFDASQRPQTLLHARAL
ncbi:hypothetical protein [Pararhodobacter zhoushanensis]|uniref:Uncharacterized protein n=1 Tax=Pararhodobacter zhoushanensis TaxID=2479545 RepID=A0ABT3GWM4_9RHOB|nr:hypothetical protein [Pararhodobacter zhoushanensis]MCW1931953.1 hypothetical protein [Pararhodobacter zhoushanensis]